MLGHRRVQGIKSPAGQTFSAFAGGRRGAPRRQVQSCRTLHKVVGSSAFATQAQKVRQQCNTAPPETFCAESCCSVGSQGRLCRAPLQHANYTSWCMRR